jgi:hypothetical protein
MAKDPHPIHPTPNPSPPPQTQRHDTHTHTLTITPAPTKLSPILYYYSVNGEMVAKDLTVVRDLGELPPTDPHNPKQVIPVSQLVSSFAGGCLLVGS